MLMILGIFLTLLLAFSSPGSTTEEEEGKIPLPMLVVPSPNERDLVHGFPIDGYSECMFDRWGTAMYDLRCHRVFEDYYRRVRENAVLYNIGDPAYDRARAARWFKAHPLPQMQK